MRIAIGAAVLVLGMAAQPAFAGEGAAPVSGGAAPLYTAIAAAPTIAATVAPAAIAPAALSLSAVSLTAAVAEDVVAPATSFRLSSVALAAAPAKLLSGELGDAGLRRRYTGNSMVEFYPFAGSGLHLSGGTRLFSRRNFIAETENSARGLLQVTRSTMAPIATRAGFKRFNPALTAGYTFAVSKLAQIGVEGGALMSHAFAGTPGLPHRAFGYRNDTSFRPDAIANLVFGMHF